MDFGSWEVLVTCKYHICMRVGWVGRQWWAGYKAGVKSLRAGGHLGIQIGKGAMRERVLAGGAHGS